MRDPPSEPRDDEEEYYSGLRKAARTLAPFYDAVTLPISGLRHRVVDFASAGRGSRVLDVGTGTGKQAFAFAKRGYDVVGIDISEDMLEIANRKNNYENVRFQLARATSLPFEDGSFDVSCVSFALHDMTSAVREKALKEMVRVTKPRGVLVIVDYGLPRNKLGRFLVYRFVKLYEKYYPEFIKSDFETLLRRSGVEIQEQRSVLLGAGRIWRGTTAVDEPVHNAHPGGEVPRNAAARTDPLRAPGLDQ